MAAIRHQDRPKAIAASATRRWAPLRLVLLAAAALAAAIVLGLYAFLTAWYVLSGSG